MRIIGSVSRKVCRKITAGTDSPWCCGHWGRSHTSGVSDDQQWYMAVIQLRGSDTRPANAVNCVLSSSTSSSSNVFYWRIHWPFCGFLTLENRTRTSIEVGTLQHIGSDTRPANAVNCVLSSPTTTSSQCKCFGRAKIAPFFQSHWTRTQKVSVAWCCAVWVNTIGYSL